MPIKQLAKKGTVIFDEGSPSDCAYIIGSGKVEILEKMADGSQKVLGVLKENDIFGEMGLIEGLPRSATARALEDTEIYVMTKDTFQDLSKSHPEALIPILKVLTARLRDTLFSLRKGHPPGDKDPSH